MKLPDSFRFGVASALLIAGAAIASADSSPPVLIEQDGVRLTLRQFDQALEKLPASERAEITRTPELLSHFAADLFAEQAIVHEAERQGLDRNPRIAARIEQARRSILRRALLEQQHAQLEMPDFDALAEEHYLARPDRFTRPARIRAAQIFLAATPEERDAVREQAEALLAELQAGADFAELAQAHSQDPSAARGGEMKRWLTAGASDHPVIQAAFQLDEPGAFSTVQESEQGFHIVRLLERESERLQTFAQVKDRIVLDLAETYQEQMRRDYLISFMPDDTAIVNQELLRSLLNR